MRTKTLTKFKSQVLTLVLTIAALAVGQSAWADELTVYDGTVTNINVPAYTYYYFGYTRSQFVIPADELADMDGGTINSITFYTGSSNIPLTTSTADVYLKEVDYTTISAFELKANSSIVYQGTLSIVSNGTGGSLTITFSTPYTYHGGNLLIGIENTATKTTNSVSFYGQAVTGAALYATNAYSNDLDSYPPFTADFIPKTSFGYTPSASVILRPENLTASELEYNSAKLGWTERGTATSWEICVNGDEDHLVEANSNSFTITGLTAETDYSVKVRSINGTERSRWSKAVNLTTPEKTPRPTDVTLTGITHNSSTFSWTENGTATAWQICLNDDESNLINANSNPYTIDNLSLATDYTMKVRAVGSDENSAWSVVTNFRTTVVAETVGANWSDDFEGTTCNWELINGNLTNAWTWGTATNNGGTHALYISNDGGTTNAYTNTSSTIVYAAKLLTFENGKYEFSYGWKAKGDNCWDYLRVALVPVTMPLTAGTSSPYNFYNTLPTGWIALDGGSQLTEVSTWQNKKVVVDNVAAGNYYVVFAWCNEDYGYGDNPPAAIDNVSINHISLSYEVENLAVSDIDTNSPSISWTTTGEATQWQVSYSTSLSFDESTTQTVIVNSATYTMTGLQPSSRYYVKVRAYNDDSNFGLWSEVADFFTVKTLPYEYGFENANEFESWSMVHCEDDTGISEYATRKGNNGFKFHYTSNPPQYLISPCLDGSAGVALSFYYKNYSYSYPETFKVGYSTTTNDISSFTWGDEITANDENTWVKYENNFPVGTKYIAIQHTSDNHLYLCLDDFRFLVPSACPMPRNLAASNITFTSADITWDADGMSKWNLRYKKTNDISWTVVENLTEATCPLVSLDVTAAYQVQVQAVDGTVPSNWSEALTFFTNKGLPYEFGFEDNSDLKNWKGVNCGVYASSYYYHNGNKSFCFDATDNPPRYLISPLLDGSNGILLSFYYRAKNNNVTESFKVGYSTTTDDVSAFTWGEEFSYEDEDWNQYANEFPIGTKYIAVQYTSFDKKGLYLDDFSFTAPACPKPYNLAASNETTNSATITWATTGSTEWKLQYKKASDTDWTIVDNLTEATYSFTNLSEGTKYNVQVQGKDGNNTSSWGDVFSFSTVRNLPYSYGFEDTDELNNWNMVNCDYYTEITNYAKREGDNGFQFRYTTYPPQYLISPCLDGSAGVALSFYYRNSDNPYPETFKVGYSTTTKDISAFTWGDEITANDVNTWVKYENNFPVGTKYIAIQHTSYDQWSLYVDDFSFTDFTNIKVNLELADNVDNSTLITDNDGKAADVTLSGRTLTADNWNTLCVPFNLSSTQIESVFGTGTLVKTLSSYANDGTTVTITFESADEIVAGKPYIIMPVNPVANPVFSNVVIDKTMNDVTAGEATFKGTYDPTALIANDKQKLFLANNKLWYPTANVTVKACRAYFELSADVPELGNNAPNIVIDFGEETTSLSEELRVKSEEFATAAWYTLDGRKLSGKPTAKGIYIVNGHKVVVK